jgi:hypothetical protein
MHKILAAVPMFLVSCFAFAASKEMESAADAPAEMVDMVWVVVFIVGFFAMIIGFFVYLWYLEKKKKKAGH